MQKLLLFFSIIALHLSAVGIAADPFVINLDHADRIAMDSRLYSEAELKQVARYYAETSEGQQQFRNAVARIQEFMRLRDFPPNQNYREYIFSVNMRDPGLVYFLTGNSELGQIIHDLALKVADMPLDFWLHSTRNSHVSRNRAALQTGEMMIRLVPGLDLAHDIFTPQERTRLETALREKGIHPGFIYLEEVKAQKRIINWTPIIAGGVYLAARFNGDGTAADEAFRHLKDFINQSFESDGSYGEGPQYYFYPVTKMLEVAAAMPETLRHELFRSGVMLKSTEYPIYSQVFSRFNGKPIRIQFRDGQQFVDVSPQLYVIAALTGSPIMTAWAKRFNVPMKCSGLHSHILLLTKQPPEGELEQLPCFRVFDNGEAYIRDGWQSDGLVFAMLSGGGTRTHFSHDRPNRNGVALAAYGEYLLVNPGHSSYQGKNYAQWDWTTRGSNCVTINNRNQKFPHKIGHTANPGYPVAEYVATQDGESCSFLVSEAYRNYTPKLKTALRAVVYVKAPGYFVIFDRVAGFSPLNFDAYWHFNNLDGKARLDSLDRFRWQLTRPRAGLSLWIGSDQPISTRVAPGILHASYSYLPGGMGESKFGSAFELVVSSPNPALYWYTATVLIPWKNGAKPKFSVSGSGTEVVVTIAGRIDHFHLNGNHLTAKIGDCIETVSWK